MCECERLFNSSEVFFHQFFVVLIIYESQVSLYSFRIQKNRSLCTMRQRTTRVETEYTNSRQGVPLRGRLGATSGICSYLSIQDCSCSL